MFQHVIDEELTLKLFQDKDANALFQLTDHSRDYLREWLSWVDSTTTVQHSKEFIQHTRKSLADQSGLTAGIIYKGDLAGCIGFNRIDMANKAAYIGYWLGHGFQGNGIMTRAARALTDYAFQELNLNRVNIRAAYENKKSRAIPERLGFTKEGQIRQAEWLYDHYVDHVVYGMLASEWK